MMMILVFSGFTLGFNNNLDKNIRCYSDSPPSSKTYLNNDKSKKLITENKSPKNFY